MAKLMEIQAPILRRAFAFLIDLLLCDLVIISPFAKVLTAKLPKDYSALSSVLSNNADLVSEVFAILVVICIVIMLYFALTEYRLGQTFGKMIMNLYVVGTEGKPTLLQCITRSVFLIPVFPFVLLWVVDPLFMAFSDSRRLSEKLSKTKTVGFIDFS